MSNALKGAFDAKVGKVPVIAVGVPVIIVGAIAIRMFGKKNAAADAASSDTSQPAFFAKSVPDTWAAVDPGTGVAHSPDGTITYIPTDGTDQVPGKDPSTPVTPVTPTPVTPSPSTPGTLSAHQTHALHTQHVAHVANQGTTRDTPNHALTPHQATVAHAAHEATIQHRAHVAATKK